jgi:hypothetical protein
MPLPRSSLRLIARSAFVASTTTPIKFYTAIPATLAFIWLATVSKRFLARKYTTATAAVFRRKKTRRL